MQSIVVAAGAAAAAVACGLRSGPRGLLAQRRSLEPPTRWRRHHGGIVAVAALSMIAVTLPFAVDRSHLAVIALVAVGVGAAALRLKAQGRDRARRLASRSQAIGVCDALVAELRAGQPPAAALTHTAQEWVEMGAVASTARMGGDVPAALRNMSLRPGAEPFAQVAAGWDVAYRSGAGLADVIDRLSLTLRSDEDVRLEIAGALGPPRATARLLAVLPLFGAGLGVSLGGDPFGVLFGSMFGALCLAGGSVLALTGLFWVEHLAAKAEV